MKSFGAESFYKLPSFLAESGLIQVSNSSFGRAFSSEMRVMSKAPNYSPGLVD